MAEKDTVEKKPKRLNKEEMMGLIRRITSGGRDGGRPTVVHELYNPKNLSLVTETQPRMILPIVRMKVLLAATDPERQISLIEVFIDEYDARMVSFKRKGRLELLGALQALSEAEGMEEVPLT